MRVDVDMRYTLLHQKLAMFNCCMYRKTGVYPTPENIAKLNRQAQQASGVSQETEEAASAAGTRDSTSAVNDTAETISKVVINPSRKVVQVSPLSAIIESSRSSRQLASSSSTSEAAASTAESTARPGASTASTLVPGLTSGSARLPSREVGSIGRQTHVLHGEPSNASFDTTVSSIEGTSWTSDRSWDRFSIHEMPSTGSAAPAIRMPLSQENSDRLLSGRSGIDRRTRQALVSESRVTPTLPAAMPESDMIFEPMEGWGEESVTATVLPSRTEQTDEFEADGGNTSFGTAPEESAQDDDADDSVENTERTRSLQIATSGDLASSFIQVGHFSSSAITSTNDTLLLESQALGKSNGSYPDASVAADIKPGRPGIDEGVRVGHLRILQGMFLAQTGEPIWEPRTQASGYLTEDMVREQEEILQNLGTSAEAAKLRARMQCAQLISGSKFALWFDILFVFNKHVSDQGFTAFDVSVAMFTLTIDFTNADMEAFKAANPYAMLQDFVRWHSPRDWIETADGKARMSDRMMDPGNLWRECWDNANRVPADQQKPLFDHEKETAKVINFLENNIPAIATQIEELGHRIVTMRWSDIATDAIASLDSIIEDVRKIELDLCYAVSILRKDEAQAVRFLRAAAEQNHARAQVRLADFLSVGRGCEQNMEEALIWYERAADQGSVGAMSAVARCYEEGLGCVADIDRAIEWYEKAASWGDHASSERLIHLVANSALLTSIFTNGYAARAA
eukprot:jgi/Hompol1/4318/HPOL_001572-RA